MIDLNDRSLGFKLKEETEDTKVYSTSIKGPNDYLVYELSTMASEDMVVVEEEDHGILDYGMMIFFNDLPKSEFFVSFLKNRK